MSELAKVFKRFEDAPLVLLVTMALAAGFTYEDIKAALKEYMESK